MPTRTSRGEYFSSFFTKTNIGPPLPPVNDPAPPANEPAPPPPPPAPPAPPCRLNPPAPPAPPRWPNCEGVPDAAPPKRPRNEVVSPGARLNLRVVSPPCAVDDAVPKRPPPRAARAAARTARIESG